MILTNVYNIEVKRLTSDIDLGIYLNTWSQFDVLKNELIKSKNFEFARKPNRFKFKNTLLFDIIPFGEISSANKTIAWPPELEIVMGTPGVEEAYNHFLESLKLGVLDISEQNVNLHVKREIFADNIRKIKVMKIRT